MNMGLGVSARAAWSPRALARLALVALSLLMAGSAVVTVARIDWDDVATYREARQWPSVGADILAVSLERRASPAAGGMVQALVLSGSYAYEVDGRRYEGDRVSLRDSSEMHNRHLQSLYARLNFARLTGRPLAVVYDPGQPERAFVDITVDWGRVIERLVLACALLMIALAAIVVARVAPSREA